MFEKNIYEEIAKITDEKVRGYYQQDMRNRIYSELRAPQQPAAKISAAGTQRQTPPPARRIVREQLKVRHNLDEKVARFILSAFVCYPELIGEFEEKVGMFEIGNAELSMFWEKMADISREHEQLDAETLWRELASAGLDKIASSLWELKMLKQQKPFINKLREEINNKILEMQLGQIEKDIKECLRIMENSESFPDDVYERCEMLKKDREMLLRERNM